MKSETINFKIIFAYCWSEMRGEHSSPFWHPSAILFPLHLMRANGPTAWQPCNSSNNNSKKWAKGREHRQRGINHTPRKPQAESRQSKAILSCIFMAKQGSWEPKAGSWDLGSANCIVAAGMELELELMLEKARNMQKGCSCVCNRR